MTETLLSHFDEIINGVTGTMLESEALKEGACSKEEIKTQAELILGNLIDLLREGPGRTKGRWKAVSQIFTSRSNRGRIPNTPSYVKISIWGLLERMVENGVLPLSDVVEEMMTVESLLEDCWVTILTDKRDVQNDSSRHRIRRIEDLQSLTDILANETDYKGTYDTIAEKISGITEVPRCSLLVFNDKGVLEPVASNEQGAREKLALSSPDELLSVSDLASLGKSLVIDCSDPGVPEVEHILSNYDAEKVLLVPMKSGDDYVGLTVLDYAGPGDFSSEQIDLAVACANQAGISIEKSKLMLRMENSLKHMAAIGVIARTMTAKLDGEEQFLLLIEMAMRLIRADGGGIHLLDEETDEYVEKAVTGEPVWKDSDSVQPIARWVCEYGEPIMILKGSEDPRFGKVGIRMEAVAIAPLLIRGKAIGVMSLATGGRKARYGKEDLELFRNFASQAAVSIENTQLYERLQDAYLGAISSLVAAIEARDPYTVGHSNRVTKYTVAIARELSFSSQEVEEIRLAGLLHDVGKIGIPDKILNKPGPLSEEEYAAIKMHPTLSVRIVEPLPHLGNILPMIYHHHERFDGKGYIEGMSGEDIPIGARVISVADAFEAMTSDRPYREALSREAAIQELINGAGSQFDPVVVDTFIRLLKTRAYAT